jgi:predicted CopG family antitoxin
MRNTISTPYKRCTVLLKEDVYKELRNKGRFGESFSDVVARLLAESNKPKRETNIE